MEEACTVESAALAVSQRWLERGEPGVLSAALMGDLIGILRNSSGNATDFPTAVTIDIEFRQSKLRYWVRLKGVKGEARRQLWVEEQVPPKELNRLGKYRSWPAEAGGARPAEPPEGWRRVHSRGSRS